MTTTLYRKSPLELFTPQGERLFLLPEERHRFLKITKGLDLRDRMLCRLIHYTGCKANEAKHFSPSQIDFSSSSIIIKPAGENSNLKLRSIPAPELFLIEIHHYFKAQFTTQQNPLWSVSRHLVWRIVKQAMKKADIDGLHATPTGMRHGFAVTSLQAKPPIPIKILQGWLGHENYELTCSYLSAILTDEDEQTCAKRLWASDK